MTVTFSERKFPVVPSPFDPRDFSYARLGEPVKKPMLTRVMEALGKPEVIDLREWCGPVKDQGDLGCCTGFTYAGYREFLLRKYFGEEVTDKNTVLSPLFVYWYERFLEGDVNMDRGANMRTGCKVLNQYGVCSESLNPYDTGKYIIQPTDEMVQDASKFKIMSYHKLNDIADWKDSLRRGLPIALGFLVFESFEHIVEFGMLPMPVPGERQMGGHAVLCVGFDDGKNCFIVRNSWGASWGDRGCFYMPYEFVNTPGYVFDAWVCTLGNV